MCRKLCIYLMFMLAVSISASVNHGPSVPRGNVTDILHGISVADPYRALEDMKSETTEAWVNAQRVWLKDHIDPTEFEKFHQRIAQIADFKRQTPPILRGNRVFFSESANGGGRNHMRYYVRDGENGTARLLLDSQKMFPDLSFNIGGAFVPSPDGRLVAYGVGKRSVSWFTLRIFDVDHATVLEDSVSGIRRTGSGPMVAWLPKGDGFYYPRFPAPSQGQELTAIVENQKLYFHRIGTPQSEDRLVYSAPGEPDRLFEPTVSGDGRFLIVDTVRGSAHRNTILVQDLVHPGSDFRNLTERVSANFTLIAIRNGTIWFHTDLGAPRGRVVSMDLTRPPSDRWNEVLPQTADQMVYANLVADRLIVSYLHDALPIRKIYTLQGKFERDLIVPRAGTIFGAPWGVGFAGRPEDRRAVFTLTGPTDPGTVFLLDPQTGRVLEFAPKHFQFDPDQFVVEQSFYTSGDGTRVPLFITSKKGHMHDGPAPMILYGYGALLWPAYPFWQPQMLAWMEGGGRFAVAAIRGGGEYGEPWHQAGIRERRESAIEDYLAAAKWLVDNKYTTRQKLVANGGSLSGPLAGIALVRHPEQFGAVLIDIPLLDLVRYTNFTGARMWMSELGSPEDPNDLKTLLRISPYHNIRPNVCYPPTLITAGGKDDRAVPLHAFKFTAALQDAQSCDSPILLQLVPGAGHNFGGTVDESVETWSNQIAFLKTVLK